MAKGKRATLNGGRTIDRITGRLDRIRGALLELEKRETGLFDFEQKRRIKDKIASLEKEQARLSGELQGYRDAINRVIK